MLIKCDNYAFRTLRKLFKVDPADYMISICGNDALRELSSPGKSGSFFYLTHDDKYMIKTMKKSEVKVSPISACQLLLLAILQINKMFQMYILDYENMHVVQIRD